MTGTSSDAASQARPDPASLDDIAAQLPTLIAETRRWRRARWVSWLALGLAAAVGVMAMTGWLVYRDEQRDDQQLRSERRASLERALLAECQSSADQTADLRTAFNVLIGVAVQPGDVEAAAAAERLNARLDEAVPARDCVQEARDRAADG